MVFLFQSRTYSKATKSSVYFIPAIRLHFSQSTVPKSPDPPALLLPFLHSSFSTFSTWAIFSQREEQCSASAFCCWTKKYIYSHADHKTRKSLSMFCAGGCLSAPQPALPSPRARAVGTARQNDAAQRGVQTSTDYEQTPNEKFYRRGNSKLLKLKERVVRVTPLQSYWQIGFVCV